MESVVSGQMQITEVKTYTVPPVRKIKQYPTAFSFPFDPLIFPLQT